MKPLINLPRNLLARVPLFLVVGLLLIMQNTEVRAQATITQNVGVSSTIFLSSGGPYGWTDLTSVSGQDLVFTDSGAGSELQATGTVTLTLPTTSWEWVPGQCVATVSGGGGNVTFAQGGTAQQLVLTLNAFAIPAAGNITCTVLAARSTTAVTAAVSATAIAVTGNTMTSLTDAAWGTTVAVVAGSSIAWTTPGASGDSTDLADGDGGWDIPTVFAATDVHDSDYLLWWHTDSTVIDISINDGAQRATRDSSNVEVDAWINISASPTTISLLTADLQDFERYGVEYYLFATTRESGTRKVGRCGPIRVFHYPTNNLDLTDPNSVNDMVDFTSNNTDYLDSGLLFALDDGAEDGSGQTSVTWTLQTIDFDDNADVRLYYSTSATLSESDLVISGVDGSETITGLTGATLLDGSDVLLENDDPDYTWSIYTDDSDYVPAGTYYIYVASNDGYHQDLDLAASQFSNQTYVVAHNPILIIQDPWVDAVADPFTFPAASQRYINLNWGLTIAGDQDPDDSATISFYLDDDTGDDNLADFNQTTIATLTATATATDDDVTNGELIYTTTVSEDPDHQWNNHVDIPMSLWSSAFMASVATADAARDLHIYAVITSGSQSRITTFASEDTDYVVTAAEDITNANVAISNAQDAFVVSPPDLGGEVSWGEAYRVAWDFAWNFGQANQNVLLLLGDVDMRTQATFNGTYGTGVLGLADLSNDLWVMNSSDGTVANNTLTDIISGPSFGGSFDFQPHTMTGASINGAQALATDLVNEGTYYVYVVVSSAANAVIAADADLVFQAPGPLRISSESGPTSWGYNMLPNNFAVSHGDTVTFSIYPNSGVATAEIAAVYIDVDTTYWDVVNPSAPFTVGSSFTSTNVVENGNHSGDTSGGMHHLNFVYGATGSPDANLDGGTAELATYQLIHKHTGTDNPRSTFITFAQDVSGGRYTAFYNGGGNLLPVSVQVPAANAESYPRATIEGTVDLQLVTDYTDIEATIALSPEGAIHGVELWDALYLATNDTNASEPGVQVVLNEYGEFRMTNIPNGEYDVTVHVEGWLDQTVNVVLQFGDHTGDTDPIYTDRVTQTIAEQQLQFLAGDCAGYTDYLGNTTPDNQIDATDLTAVKNAYNARPDSTSWNALCDFNRNGWVEIQDLNVTNANQGSNGVPLIYRAGLPNNGVIFRMPEVPEYMRRGEELIVAITMDNAADVRAYDLRLSAPGMDVVSLEHTNLLGDWSEATYLSQNTRGELVWAGAIKGCQREGFAGESVIAVATLRAQRDGRPNLRLISGQVVNSGNEMQIAGVDNSSVLPANFELGSNYPNPFNPVTSINFAIPQDSFVKLTVYNMLGQKVRTLVADQLVAGHHQVNWTGINDAGIQVASGLYVYQMEAPGFRQAHKMVLLK
ncbi:MAG: T9SS type A sorting domain-containing protein [Candidatus Delongbacteria bacterium]|nr:T9SS type A sorting domain-containing protein [Candidatus Delongbacteria bacterium]